VLLTQASPQATIDLSRKTYLGELFTSKKSQVRFEMITPGQPEQIHQIAPMMRTLADSSRTTLSGHTDREVSAYRGASKRGREESSGHRRGSTRSTVGGAR
jgi:hypothetical protein